MAFDTIRAGIKVLTRHGRTAGVIESFTRHPVTRSIVAVVIRPEGVTNQNEFIVTSARNLRAV